VQPTDNKAQAQIDRTCFETDNMTQ